MAMTTVWTRRCLTKLGSIELRFFSLLGVRIKISVITDIWYSVLRIYLRYISEYFEKKYR